MDLFASEPEENEPGVASEDIVARTAPLVSHPVLIGQEDIERQILGMIAANRLPYALILKGPQGVGKFSFSVRLARYLMTAPTNEPAGLFGDVAPAVPSTLMPPAHDTVYARMMAGGQPDFLKIDTESGDKEKKTPTIDVDSVRKLSAFLRMRTTREGGWRVAIIDDADRMNRNAQNALLKNLEEPPERTLLILIVHRLGALVPTIRSRARAIDFYPLSESDFMRVVKSKNPDLSDADAAVLYALSDGCAGQGIEILDGGGLDLFRQFVGLWKTWPDVNRRDWAAFVEPLIGPAQDKTYRLAARLFLWWAREILRAGTDVRVIPMLERLSGWPGVANFVGHFSLAQGLQICEKLDMHFDRVLALNLERRQGILSAVQLMRM